MRSGCGRSTNPRPTKDGPSSPRRLDAGGERRSMDTGRTIAEAAEAMIGLDLWFEIRSNLQKITSALRLAALPLIGTFDPKVHARLDMEPFFAFLPYDVLHARRSGHI
uniref:Uncharacterized protein n=1 Tax=Odontella aurita TaxID=265563 RepID=A0A7S4K213_9STRA|mmetsp:Transcript_58835/g.175051  ORF Transcript_58835/g.175051 Transcript_58835/m.175051 type:complete len:108 (+) Transcript_58835:98-421(+)